MSRIFSYFFILIFAFIIFPKINSVFAAVDSTSCTDIYKAKLEQYGSLGEEFWSCRSYIFQSIECQIDNVNCNQLVEKQCRDKIFEIITTDTEIIGKPWLPSGTDGSFASCYKSWVSQAWSGTVYDDNLTEFIKSNYRKYSKSSDPLVADQLNNILNCGFAGDPDSSKRSCCDNTIADLDSSAFEGAEVVDNSQCIGGLEWPGEGCVLKPEFISAPLKSFVVNQLQARLDQAELALDDNPVPQCIVGEAVGEGASCMCERSSGAKICEDMNQYVNKPAVQEYRKILDSRKHLISIDSGNEIIGGVGRMKENCASSTDAICIRFKELDKHEDVIKYNDSYGKCANSCMDLNNEESAEKHIYTALGCITASPRGLIDTVFQFGIGLAGVVALGCIIFAAFLLQTSAGDPERVKSAQELMTSCITGLIMIIFSVLILQIIGVQILRIPGFGS